MARFQSSWPPYKTITHTRTSGSPSLIRRERPPRADESVVVDVGRCPRAGFKEHDRDFTCAGPTNASTPDALAFDTSTNVRVTYQIAAAIMVTIAVVHAGPHLLDENELSVLIFVFLKKV